MLFLFNDAKPKKLHRALFYVKKRCDVALEGSTQHAYCMQGLGSTTTIARKGIYRYRFSFVACLHLSTCADFICRLVRMCISLRCFSFQVSIFAKV